MFIYVLLRILAIERTLHCNERRTHFYAVTKIGFQPIDAANIKFLVIIIIKNGKYICTHEKCPFVF